VARAVRRRREHDAGGDGLRGERPGESKHANIGISLPGTGETPAAPVYVDGEKVVTLRGDNIGPSSRPSSTLRGHPVREEGRLRPASPTITTAHRRNNPKTTHIMSQTLQAVRGMNDILPDDAETWEYFEDIVRDWLQSYGYRPIRMPLVEPTPLFKRAIGEVTDIVEKEMYSFEDALNGEHLTLRPEGTASCVRAAIQHNLLPSAARSGCTTTARCSATSARRKAATASSTRSASRPWALPGRISTPS
jgi:hypothetical protein